MSCSTTSVLCGRCSSLLLRLAPFAVSAVLLATCSPDPGASPQPTEDATPAEPLPEPPAPEPVAAPAPDPSKPAPLPVPRARYGEPALPLVDEAIKVAPLENGSVLLIVIDAFNAEHVSSYGYVRQTTPHIDALAARGIRFSNWVSNSSWTRPSYTTLVTGMTKREHGVELGGTNLENKVTTLAERFREAGYRTAGFVGNPLVRKIFGYAQGFQVYEDTEKHRTFPRGYQLTDKAIDWLKKVKDRPFFAVLFYTDPHTPYRPLRKYRKFMEEVGATENIEYPLREYLEPLPKADHEAIVAAYDGEVAYADAQVGRLLDALQELGLAERTTVAVTADHGEMFGEHNCYLHSYHMWEPALRVPAVIASPAIPVKGVVDDRPRTHVDLAPTLLELSGLEVPESLSGVSVARTLADPTAGRDRPLFSQYNARGVKRQAARIGRWKLVHHHQVEKGRFFGAMERQRKATDVPRADPSELPSVAFDGARFELYDLVNDTGEVNDLFKDKVDEPIVAELKKIIDQGMGVVEDGAAVPELSKETLEALKAAGYIQ